ncbi:MAG TPA: DUF488 family protein [Acidimicrobiales bacterium]|jgi:uncharacterized protein YeaO (DUF488 family)
MLARVYDIEIPAGWKVLADRLWPRGVRKSDPRIDEWAKDVAPSTALRKWYGHDPERFEVFAERYREELRRAVDGWALLQRRARGEVLVLLTATRDLEQSHLVVLREILQEP